jgi:hypothetical protein
VRTGRVALIVAFILGVATVGGIAAAAQKSKQLSACANSRGVLQVMSSKGKCPKSFSKVTISARGPRGAAGRRGPRGHAGPRGPIGQAGPGAMSSVATTRSNTGTLVALTGTKLTVNAKCLKGGNAQLIITGSGDYLVHGVSDFTNSGNLDASTLSHPANGAEDSAVIDQGSGLIDFETNTNLAATTSYVEVSDNTKGTGKLSTDLLLTKGTATFTVDTFLMESAGSCEASAQITQPA